MIRWTPYSLYFCAPVLLVLVTWALITAVMTIVGPWVNQS